MEVPVQTCQAYPASVQTHIKTQVHHILIPGRRFSHIHVDLVGPLPHLSFHEMFGGNPSPVHYSRRLCKSPPTFMDPSFQSPFSNNL